MKRATLFLSLGFLLGLPLALPADENSTPGGVTKVDLVFRGGHDTDPSDRGRPVVLVAAALAVPPAVFREAFTHVHPAGPGEQPHDAQVRKNKQALMQRLGPYGVTDDRLNEVSNYYRYRRETGELWRHVDAAGYALINGGKIVSVTITNPGAGYTTPPVVSAPGAGLTVYPMAVLTFGTDLSINGSVAKIVATPLGDVGRHLKPASEGDSNVPVPNLEEPPPSPPH